MFSGRHAMDPLQTDDGTYFIDRDGSQFRHILNYLRTGTVVTLPKEEEAKEELVIEADYYGLTGLVKDLRMPKLDLAEHVPAETSCHWEEEGRLRAMFVDGTAKDFSDPFHGLIPLFPAEGKEDARLNSIPVKYNTEILAKCKLQGMVFMDDLRMVGKSDTVITSETRVTVGSLEEFETNFNKEWSNVLHRLRDVLREEPLVMAGGSVLRALTASEGIRTAEMWGSKSDIDLFLYGCSREEANRISKRVFDSLAGDTEKWAVIRSKGVCNVLHYNNAVDGIETKVQIVLRIYDSPTEVLLGFDVDCCCCAFDGSNVWVSPRWCRAVQSGMNVLNPLHAWPNKPSYEMRLAKFAFRGFAVLVPGVNRARIDLDQIDHADISDLKGLARFIRISSEISRAQPYNTREYADEGDDGAVQDERYRELFWIHHSRPRILSEIPNLKKESLSILSADAQLIKDLDEGYDDPRSKVIIPEVYQLEHSHWPRIFPYSLRSNDFPLTPESRHQAWEEILDAGENHANLEYVDRRLIDSWDTEKRSREYLNGKMCKFDLDNIYFSRAYMK